MQWIRRSLRTFTFRIVSNYFYIVSSIQLYEISKRYYWCIFRFSVHSPSEQVQYDIIEITVQFETQIKPRLLFLKLYFPCVWESSSRISRPVRPYPEPRSSNFIMFQIAAVCEISWETMEVEEDARCIGISFKAVRSR